jgi:hypothetical protein
MSVTAQARRRYDTSLLEILARKANFGAARRLTWAEAKTLTVTFVEADLTSPYSYTLTR